MSLKMTEDISYVEKRKYVYGALDVLDVGTAELQESLAIYTLRICEMLKCPDVLALVS